MDIVHIILGKANPNRMNGVNSVVYNLASQQKEHGKNVSVWGITKDLEHNYPERNFETQLFIKGIHPFSIPQKLKEKIIQSGQDTVFHLHGGWIPVFYSLSKLFKKHNKRFVITPHGAYNSEAINKNKGIKKLYFNLFEKQLLQNAHKIHCIGKSEVEGISHILKTNKATLVPYGFETEENPLMILWSKKIIFGYLGRIDIHTKGLDIMIEAFEDFIKKEPNAKLWIIGEGKDKAHLQAIVSSKNLDENVEFLGSRFGKEKEYLLQSMDAFLHPSRNEGLPVSVLEAASFGKPCIVSAFTNIGEPVEQYNAGYMFAEYGFSELSKAMHRLHKAWKNKALFEQLSRNAQKMVKQEYEWGRILNRLEMEVYGS